MPPVDTIAVFVAGVTVGAVGVLLWLVLSSCFSKADHIEIE